MTNSMQPQSSLDITTPGGGEQRVSQRRRQQRDHQQEQQQQQQQSNDQPNSVVCLSQLSLQDEQIDEEDMTSSTGSSISIRRRAQWQDQQKSCPEFAAQWIAPAQKTTEDQTYETRRSSFHYNLHSKLNGLFQQ